MATNKSHAALAQHVKAARAAHAQTGQSLDKIEEILSALKGQPQQSAAQPVPPTSPGVSPLGGQAS